ncbi:phosphatidylserine decarboxylase [Hyphomicrobium sp. xq]|uniref:Phosphatidylserine decarboxylase proenzyme n=1 Tax=Hyphomicrobium album TaxID=2665159 RepID=A0A6I3KGY0_9HYPH|nr:phosphatidylserine decarboxylase [Hyphomicrobium album]MTD94234.1 phosphatidylserine decarboxylase [Hyphomicrobium album]
MSNRHGIIDTIIDSLAPVNRDGHKFIAIAAGLALIFFLVWPPLAWVCVVAALYIAYFFRDPDRVTPQREGLIIAPADGRIAAIETVQPPTEMGLGSEQRVRISTFLSVLDVHITRAPVSGRIVRSIYVPGSFLNAADDKASDENERRVMIIQKTDGTEIGVVQIAGLVARRIVPFLHEGDSVGVGERLGLIRFGSRVDVYLPVGKHALVSVGQTATAGETVLADLQSAEPERVARRS